MTKFNTTSLPPLAPHSFAHVTFNQCAISDNVLALTMIDTVGLGRSMTTRITRGQATALAHALDEWLGSDAHQQAWERGYLAGVSDMVDPLTADYALAHAVDAGAVDTLDQQAA